MHKKKAFSLVESIVSMVILGLTLATTGSIIAMTHIQNQKIKNKIMAMYLTQEGLELARNARDSAWRQGLPWDCSFLNSVETEKTLYIENIENFSQIKDTFNNNIHNFCQNSLGVALTETAQKITIDNINFERKIDVKKDNEKLTIICSTTGPQDIKIDMVEQLTNWRKN